MERTNYYFISDCHLGVPNHAQSLEREKRLVAWLDSIKHDAKALYLLGDIFDFWFEYKYVVPKGYVRLLGKLAELSDMGVEIHYFTGNHDMWAFGYFAKEFNAIMHRSPVTLNINGKKLYIGHGDGLGPGDHKYKFIKKIFASKICQKLFAMLHPWVGIGVASFFSRKSRISHQNADSIFLGEKEYLICFAKTTLQKEHFDYFIFGHRHLKIDMPVGENSRYVNLGEWVSKSNYALFDGENLYLRTAGE